MASQGYIRFPNIYQDRIVFVSEDDLWLTTSSGGRAERLTAGVGEATYPFFSPDGEWIAFSGREEGPNEVYIMPASGGAARRLTFLGGNCRVVGWSPDGTEILYASNAGQFAHNFDVIYAVKPDGGLPRQLPYGKANTITYAPQGGVVLGRNGTNFARWKRYRGGTAGYLWSDPTGSGIFQRLSALQGNVVSPCWIGERVYFLSDQDGVGNVYSCTPEGKDVHQHTYQQDFYARHLTSDGRRLVFHAGAELYLFDPQSEQTELLPVTLPSVRTQRNRKFVTASTYLDTYALHPKGHQVALTTRGKAFTMGNWEGPVLQLGEQDGVRYRFLEWLNDGKRCVAVCDATGRETLVIFNPEEATEPVLLTEIDLGRVVNLVVSPIDDAIAITNHRNELIVVALEAKRALVVERSDFRRINGVAWSPDGRWLAYGFPISAQKTAIKLCDLESGATYQITDPVLEDCRPAFDPDGKYLYFLGYRVFNPVYDNLQFDLSFPRGVKPYAITLQRDLRSPFIPEPKAPDEKEKKEDDKGSGEDTIEAAKSTEQSAVEDGEGATPGKNGVEKSEKSVPPVVIDLDGITDRVLPFPVNEGRYSAVYGLKGKVLFLLFPIDGAIDDDEDDDKGPGGAIDAYNLEKYKNERIITGVGSFDVSRDNKTLIYKSGHRLRVIKAGEKPPKMEDEKRSSRESGWLDIGRIKVSIQPATEWKQMFNEAWRLQREQFWSEDMSGINWDAIYAQYSPLVEQISSRSELSDLLWEMQGELGTSHAYEMGGDARRSPNYHQGFLGVDWHYDEEEDRYRIARIIKGDVSSDKTTSPLMSPGLNVQIGEAVLAINGQRVSKTRQPQELLVNQAGNEVQLTLEDGEGKRRVITVDALSEERSARYREWVDTNRRIVHEVSKGLVGYIHIPNMSGVGYAEFHRGFLAEYDYPSLLIDVRWNGGGNVSGLLLEKLARRRLGYDFARWSQPTPYPQESPRGPMVALTDENAGSDGDIFSHSFKLMGLGPLIGKRTWGGVIGIFPRHRLVDNTMTTQPEFSFWFKDVGWNVENYGTDPDIDVDIAPQDYANKVDPQLDLAIAEAVRLIEERPTLEPTPGQRPQLGRHKQS